jgi:hypothetical protein
MIDWTNPNAVRRYHRIKARERRAMCLAEGICRDCHGRIKTRGICEDCKARRRESYRVTTKPKLAVGAKPCLDCGQTCQRAKSIRCSRCQCRRAAAMRWTKGQAA